LFPLSGETSVGDTINLGEDQKPITEACAAMFPYLWIGEAVVAIAPLESGIPRYPPFSYAAEERLKGAIYAERDILQYLSSDVATLG
jgi:hypothetical protein